MRVVFSSGENDFSGMIAAAICDEDIEVAGIIYDSGPVGVSRPQEEARSPSTLESIKMSVRLAAKVPQLYTDRVLHRLGVTRFDEYSRLQRTEGPLMREAERCGGRQLGSYCSKRWRRSSKKTMFPPVCTRLPA